MGAVSSVILNKFVSSDRGKCTCKKRKAKNGKNSLNKRRKSEKDEIPRATWERIPINLSPDHKIMLQIVEFDYYINENMVRFFSSIILC